MKKKILITIGAILFWPLWAICAFIKDFLAILLTPFDIERYINCFVGFGKNLDLIHCADYTHLVQDGEDKPVDAQPRTIGFQTMATIQPIQEPDEE